MKVNGYRQLFGYKLSSTYFNLYSAEEINSYNWNNLRLSKWWQFTILGELSLKFLEEQIKSLRPTETLYIENTWKWGRGA